MDMDMYDYLMTIQMPPLPPPKEEPKKEEPKPKPPPKPLTAREEREKKEKELAEVRAWWAGLPESERVKIRREPFPKRVRKKKKEPEKKPEKQPEDKPKETKPPPEIEKPNVQSYAWSQQLASEWI